MRLTEDQYATLQEKLAAKGQSLKEFVCDELDLACAVPEPTETLADASNSGPEPDVASDISPWRK